MIASANPFDGNEAIESIGTTERVRSGETEGAGARGRQADRIQFWRTIRPPGGARSQAAWLAWVLFLLVLPLGEGSASPAGLLTAHLTFLAALVLSIPELRAIEAGLALPALACVVWASISGALGPYLFASILAVVDLAVLLGVLAAATALARGRRERRGWLLTAIVVAGCAQAIWILGRSLLSGFAERPAGTLLNSNHAAAYLIAAFWSLIALAGREGTKTLGEAGEAAPVEPDATARTARPSAVVHAPAARSSGSPALPHWLLWAAGSVLLGAALVEASRGAAAGLLAGGALFLALRWRGLSPRLRAGAAAILAAVVLIGAAGLGLRLSKGNDPYMWDRLSLWKTDLAVAQERPLTGVGPGVFPHVSAPFDPAHPGMPVRYAKHVEATHSDPLRIVAETGAVGAFVFLWLAAALIVYAARALRAGPVSELAPLAAALSGLAAQSCFENLSARPAVTCTGAVIAALLMAPASGALCAGVRSADPEEESGTSTPSVPRAPRLVVYAVIGWAAGVFVIAPYLGHRDFEKYLAGGPEVGAWYAGAVRWNPIQPEYRAALANAVLAGRGSSPADISAGFQAIDRAIALKPIDPRYHLLRARLARRGFLAGPGLPDWIAIADGEYARAVALDPHRPQARLELGWMLHDLRRDRQALSQADDVISDEPNSFEAHRLRAAALVALGRPEEARTELLDARTRRDTLAGAARSNPYEEQILAWDSAGWEALAASLADTGR